MSTEKNKPFIESLSTIPEKPRCGHCFELIIKGRNLANAKPIIYFPGKRDIPPERYGRIEVSEQKEDRILAIYSPFSFGLMEVKLTTPEEGESNVVELRIEDKTLEEKLFERQSKIDFRRAGVNRKPLFESLTPSEKETHKEHLEKLKEATKKKSKVKEFFKKHWQWLIAAIIVPIIAPIIVWIVIKRLGV